MRIILAATPVADFVDPILGLARLLRRYSHEVVVLTGTDFVDHVRTTGAPFAPLPSKLGIVAGGNTPSTGRNDLSLACVAALTDQYRALTALIDAFQPHGVVADQMFLGAVPLMLSPRSDRPFVASCGMTFLTWPGEITLSNGPRPQPAMAACPAREANFELARQHFDKQLRALDVEPQGSPLTVASRKADIYWQCGLPEFDHLAARLPDHIKHIGLWPALPTRLELPSWAERLQDGRRLVLVTQNNTASDHVHRLLVPTMRALAHRRDLVVIGSTGGQDLSGISLPENARIADDLPIPWILPHTHALVTSDEYGAALQALACGVPMVVAGGSATESSIGARVASAGAGIDLQTMSPRETDLRASVETLLLAESPYRRAAHTIASRFARHDACEIILTSLEEQHERQRRAA